MSRLVLLQTLGDPFLINLWVETFEECRKEVDYVAVAVNAPPWIDPTPCMNLLKSIGWIRISDQYPKIHMQPHGKVIADLLKQYDSDHIMLVEDDGFIHKKGKVSSCFEEIESGRSDVVGSVRRAYTPILHEKILNTFSLLNVDDRYAYGTVWWPNFFFCKRSTLLYETDMHFLPKTFEQGEYIEPLKAYAPQRIDMDTFAWVSLQLLSKGKHARIEKQYHSYPHEHKLYDAKEWLWSPDCHWIHIGSMSFTTADPSFNLMQDTESFKDIFQNYCVNHLTLEKRKLEFSQKVLWLAAIYDIAQRETYFKKRVPANLAKIYLSNIVFMYETLRIPDSDNRINMYKEIIRTR